MQTFSFGSVPDSVIKTACLEQCPDGYHMTIRCKTEWRDIAECWNAGIDSHLEAITSRSSANAGTGNVVVHPEELHVLLRRLVDLGTEDADSLYSAILSTLDIEVV
jgi:hypothetical protein